MKCEVVPVSIEIRTVDWLVVAGRLDLRLHKKFPFELRSRISRLLYSEHSNSKT